MYPVTYRCGHTRSVKKALHDELHRMKRMPRCPTCIRLEEARPDIAAEWHFHNSLQPCEVAPTSKKKVKWFHRLPDGTYHTYFETVAARTRRYRPMGCPRCVGHVAPLKINFAKQRPALLDEWDYDKNKRNPIEFSIREKTNVWWVCSSGHSFQMRIVDRAIHGHFCPTCREEMLAKAD